MRVLRCGDLSQCVSVADLTDGGDATFAEMLGGRQAVVYSDPPWSPGNEKWWRRYAHERPPESYDRLLDAWCRCVVACRPEHVVVEQSVKPEHKQMMLDAIARCRGWDLPLIEEWVALYGSPKRPNAVLHFGHEKLPTDPSGMSGDAMTRTVFDGLRQLGALACGVVADPCTGLGMTSRMAHEFGCSFVGTELNPKRLERTIGWLVKRGYVEGARGVARAPARHQAGQNVGPIVASIRALAGLSEAERVESYNAASRALGDLVRDFAPDPALAPQLVPADKIAGNDYNPNRVASVEMGLLEQSMRADGITMAVVVMQEADRWTVIDGFHRRTVAAERLGRRYLPCAVLERERADRMASTVRHNRARGKHQVELMGALVAEMMQLGWDDERIAGALGMSPEELLRLRQMVGAARLLAADSYSRSWGRADEGAVESEADEASE